MEELQGSVKKKQKPPPRLTELEELVARHKEHIARLEKVLRCIDNETIQPDELENLKADMESYLVCVLCWACCCCMACTLGMLAPQAHTQAAAGACQLIAASALCWTSSRGLQQAHGEPCSGGAQQWGAQRGRAQRMRAGSKHWAVHALHTGV